jgi:PRTRC genetic system ThiF family protein
MEHLHMEPTYRVVLGEVKHFRILLVGCGGTGSALAPALAALAYHARGRGIEVDLTLVDDDVIEMVNCGRQNLSWQAAQVGGVPKVAELSLRLNAAYGLSIVAWPQRYEAGMGRQWVERSRGYGRCVHLLLGCVDNYLARREIAKTITAFDGRIWAIDSGNAATNGQILIGNLTDVRQIRWDALGLCSGIPSPYVQEPDLLEPDREAPNLSCAEMVLMEEQSLMVNRMAAAVAGHLISEMVLQQQVRQMGVYFSLEPFALRGVPLTADNLMGVGKERRLA